MKGHELHDSALSASMVDVLSAQPRADLEREVRPAQRRERATMIVS